MIFSFKSISPFGRSKKHVAKELIYQFQIVLLGTNNDISRIIELPSNCTFNQFNQIILNAMGWSGHHIYQFFALNKKTRQYSIMTEQRCFRATDSDIESIILDNTVRLYDHYPPKDKDAVLDHDYDFFSGWTHNIIFKKAFAPLPKIDYPRCIYAVGACPPEDCGGPSCYNKFLELYQSSKKEKKALDTKDALLCITSDEYSIKAMEHFSAAEQLNMKRYILKVYEELFKACNQGFDPYKCDIVNINNWLAHAI